MSELPLVSIITPSYNMAGYIEQAICSVLSQDYPHIEYLVMDGGSTDGTVDVLRRYGERIRFTSGRDAGPADAINRGFRQATGSIFGWLNADDFYLPGAVRAAVERFVAAPDIDAAYGGAYWVNARGETLAAYPTHDFDPDLLAQECFICQPASFLRADTFRGLMLNAGLQYAFDYDLWIRASAHCRFDRIPAFIACSRMHLENRTLGQRRGVLCECMQVLKRRYGYVPFRWIHTYSSYLLDRNDQFFEPLRPTLLKYALSLPLGLWQNHRAASRYWAEWRSVMNIDAYLRQRSR